MKKSVFQLLPLLFGGLLISFISVGCDDDDDETIKQVIYDVSGTASAANEVQPAPVVSSATGTISGTFNESTNVLQYKIDWSGLTGNATAMHFHGPATPQESKPVLIPITITTPGASGSVSESITLPDSTEAFLLAGKLYYNIHTDKYKAGEIRGNILPTKR
jgi:CHRD domain